MTERASQRLNSERSPLGVVYRIHASYLRRTVQRLGVPAQDVDDVMHEVFLVLRRKQAPSLATEGARAWLGGVARGVVANWRRGRRRSTRRLEMLNESPFSQAEPVDPERALQRQSDVFFVHAVLERMTTTQRTVLELSLSDELSGKDLADHLGVPLQTAYSRLRLARESFRRLATDLRDTSS